MSGIYFHIPFCKQACIYCNFYFEKGSKNIEPLVLALHKEIELRKNEINSPIETIYFGGGTPSFIKTNDIESLILKIKQYDDLSALKEITLEANPNDISMKQLESWKKIGINRLSIGVQSFFNHHLKWMNRAHNADEAKLCIEMALEMGFQLSVDLIFGIPNSTHEEWQTNLEQLCQYQVQHISCYSLTLEDNTPWKTLIEKRNYEKPNDEFAAIQFEMAHDFLTKNQYEHYEISNYALNQQHAVHNTAYWQRKPYLGIGPSAHSFNNKERSWNIADNNAYIQSINSGVLPSEKEILTPKNELNEYLMTGLRTKWGIDLNQIKAFNLIDECFYSKIETYKSNGLLTENNQTLTLSLKGMLYADAIASDLFV